MKTLYWVIGILSVPGLLFVGAERLASERVEVVELHTVDEAGEPVTTRLWVVDDEGYQYLRVAADGSGWFTRLLANEQFTLTRKNQTATYTHVQRPGKSEQINSLMQEKYTWGDILIGYMIGSREGSVPIELHPKL